MWHALPCPLYSGLHFHVDDGADTSDVTYFAKLLIFVSEFLHSVSHLFNNYLWSTCSAPVVCWLLPYPDTSQSSISQLNYGNNYTGSIAQSQLSQASGAESSPREGWIDAWWMINAYLILTTMLGNKHSFVREKLRLRSNQLARDPTLKRAELHPSGPYSKPHDFAFVTPLLFPFLPAVPRTWISAEVESK